MRMRRLNKGLQVRTPAKLNLFLEILGKRADRFHELETLMISVDLCDTLYFQPVADDTLDLEITGEGAESIPTDNRNLIIRAAQRLREEVGSAYGAKIRLHKRIPAEAGLAGGSSDAAATLVGLNTLWGTGLSQQELHALAAQLGSDVNFFIDSPEAAVCSGRGEKVHPISLAEPLHFVVAKPNTGLSTARVFGELKIPVQPKSMTQIASALKLGRWSEIFSGLHNRLEEVSRGLNHEVDELLRAMFRLQPNGVLMSGSGSACFALCRNRREAMRMAAILRAEERWRIFVTASHC